MKFFLMILAAMAVLMGCSGFTDCEKDDTGKCKTWGAANDTLADSLDSNDGDAVDKVEFNPPLHGDTDVALVDNDSVHGDDDAVHPLSETDAGADETIPPAETVDADSSDQADTDGDSDFDGGDTVEPQTDTLDAQETQDTEAEISLPCIPNCAGKQCGNNGCEGLCGTCMDSYTCTADFVCECAVGCQILAEPTIDVADSGAGTDADANTATTTDTKADSTPPPDETSGPAAEMIVATDTAIDTPQSETNLPPIDTAVKVEATTDTNVAEIAAETVNADTVTTVETAPNADTAIEAEAETGEDTVGEPDTFVQPCVVDISLCDDGNICTDDWCDTAAGCVHTNNAAPCDDGNQCTANDACANSVCAPGMPVVCDDNDACTDDYCTNGVGCVYEWVCECASDIQCDDLNPCTDDSCASGFCEYTFNSIACDNNDACTITDQCVGGECLGTTSLDCDDENQCTVDTCDPQSGCQHEPQTGKACNDGDACTINDICQNGVCQTGTQTCTCYTDSDCVEDDGNLCNGLPYCDKKTVWPPVCAINNPTTVVTCSPSSDTVCHKNTCEPITGQCKPEAVNDGGGCNDNSVCTTDDVCSNGVCLGVYIKCEDDNLCTDDVCQPQKGCIYPANQAGCDDGNSCTVGDICADMACASGTNICQCQNDADCAKADDGNICNGTVVCDQSAMPFKCATDTDTIIACNADQDTACFKNTCVPATGDCEMKAVNDGGGCNDGNACTSNDQCANGNCAGQSIKCDDSNVCTDDSCNPTSGCIFTSNSADCDDSNQCTLVDTCKNSQCIGSMPTDCDDGNVCTFDVCVKTSGMCQHSKLTGTACDNGDACTVNDICQNGACQAGTQNNCDCYVTADCASKEDGDLCNGTLVCDTNAMPHKCVLDPATIITCPTTSDTTCSKNTCQPVSGKCEMKAVNEGTTCQSDQCIASATCQSGQCAVTNKPDGAECDDGKSCNNNDSCQQGKCAGAPFFTANFDTGILDAGWELTGDIPPHEISGKQGFTSSPNSLMFHDAGTNSSAFLTSPTFTLLTGHTSSVIFDYHTGNVGLQQQSFVVEIHQKSGTTTLLEKGNAPPLPWTNYILSLDNYTGEVWLTFHFVGPFVFEAIDSISVGCP